MAESQSNSIETGFRDEVGTYIPLLNEGIEKIRNHPDSPGVIQELYRLAHIISGAASLIGIQGIGQSASQMETALEQVMAGRLVLNEALFNAMDLAVVCFEAFSQGNEKESRQTEIIRAFTRILGPAEEGDDSAAGLFAGEADKAGGIQDPFGPGDADIDTLLSGPSLVPEMDPFMEEETVCLPPADSAPPGIDPDIIAVFHEEVEEHFDTINQNLDILERNITGKTPFQQREKEHIRRINRAVHTIKGASGLVGMTDLSAWAHGVEDLLDWLFESAPDIDPGIVRILLKSADILEMLVSDPDHVNQGDMAELKKEFSRITGQPAESEPNGSGGQALETDCFETPQAQEENDRNHSNAPSPAPGTFRVDMERLDDLVNLASEQIISLSAFDQKLDAFQNTASELERSKSRLREISRSLEVGYEVKAIRKPGGQGPSAATGSSDTFSEFDALELDRYSQFNLIIRALTEAVVDIGEISNRVQEFHSSFEGYVVRQRVLLSEIQGKLMHTRMAPMAVVTTRMRRAVREVSEKLGKNIRLDIQGEEIELDRVIWEKLADPLLHLLRNAADHGIESPDIRRESGKADTGLVTVSASRQGNEVLIRIEDDGAGLDLTGIRAKAHRLYGKQRAEAMDKKALLDLIFTPGFSTRDQVTQISGRGVGMDVVKTNIEMLKGEVRIYSEGPGKGTLVTVRIPLTLAIIRAIICTAGDRQFAVPLNEVRDILRITPENMIQEPVQSIMTGDGIYPLYRLSDILGTAGPTAGENDTPIALKVESGDKSAAFAVDSLIGQREIVIKSLGSHLRHVNGISGATVMGDGSIVPILNVGELLTEGNGTAHPEPLSRDGEKDRTDILIVDDSVSVRRVVAKLMEDQGWRATSARDGMEALETLSSMRPDLIVLDVEMPRMNGYEFLGAKRSHPEYRDIPVVILSSRSMAKYREKAKALGANGYIVKPFKGEKFISEIKRLIAGQHQESPRT